MATHRITYRADLHGTGRVGLDLVIQGGLHDVVEGRVAHHSCQLKTMVGRTIRVMTMIHSGDNDYQGKRSDNLHTDQL